MYILHINVYLNGVMSVVEKILEANIIDFDICDITFTKSIS